MDYIRHRARPGRRRAGLGDAARAAQRADPVVPSSAGCRAATLSPARSSPRRMFALRGRARMTRDDASPRHDYNRALRGGLARLLTLCGNLLAESRLCQARPSDRRTDDRADDTSSLLPATAGLSFLARPSWAPPSCATRGRWPVLVIRGFSVVFSFFFSAWPSPLEARSASTLKAEPARPLRSAAAKHFRDTDRAAAMSSCG